MIPLYDINRRQTFPFVTVLLILANVLVFFFQLSLSPAAEQRLVFLYGMIPARLEVALAGGDITLAQAVTPLLTSIFLHGGFLHLLGNMWFLWVFGDNVEDRMGHARYLLFYLLTGIGAGVVHTLFNWGSPIPAVGASGAISGVLGAYVVLFPRSHVVTLVPLLIFWFMARIPAAVMIGYWFALQFLSGVYSLGGPQGGGVAWWAHIGGFVLGLALVLVLRKPKRPPVVYYVN
jgi:membrane associated rhomboid family serine protease